MSFIVSLKKILLLQIYWYEKQGQYYKDVYLELLYISVTLEFLKKQKVRVP